MPPFNKLKRSGLCPIVRSSSALSMVLYTDPSNPHRFNCSTLHSP
eukprot:Gb_37515 [translate_table: standard]